MAGQQQNKLDVQTNNKGGSKTRGVARPKFFNHWSLKYFLEDFVEVFFMGTLTDSSSRNPKWHRLKRMGDRPCLRSNPTNRADSPLWNKKLHLLCSGEKMFYYTYVLKRFLKKKSYWTKPKQNSSDHSERILFGGALEPAFPGQFCHGSDTRIDGREGRPFPTSKARCIVDTLSLNVHVGYTDG